MLDPVLGPERLAHVYGCGVYFQKAWRERLRKPPAPDLISMMIHFDAMSDMSPEEFIGNLILLIVRGNDTTRNSMTAAVHGLDRPPKERTRLEEDASLIPNETQEIVRWQTQLAHPRPVTAGRGWPGCRV